jgi:hypothetical protein
MQFHILILKFNELIERVMEVAHFKFFTLICRMNFIEQTIQKEYNEDNERAASGRPLPNIDFIENR